MSSEGRTVPNSPLPFVSKTEYFYKLPDHSSWSSSFCLHGVCSQASVLSSLNPTSSLVMSLPCFVDKSCPGYSPHLLMALLIFKTTPPPVTEGRQKHSFLFWITPIGRGLLNFKIVSQWHVWMYSDRIASWLKFLPFYFWTGFRISGSGNPFHYFLALRHFRPK
jgi:hypothetical protein